MLALVTFSLLVTGAAALALPSLHHNDPRSTSSWDLTNVTFAAVRSAPINWPSPVLNKSWTGVTLDLNATVQYGVELIAQAASKDVRLLAFPETYFPGYPKGNEDNDWRALHIKDYIANSLVYNSTQWNTLVQAAQDYNMYLALGFSELADNKLYMAQALISPDGEILIHRHKLRPSGGERLIWSDGTLDQLKVVSTPLGRIGLLECWEHFHPAMTFKMQVQLEDIHVAAFPYNPDVNDTAALWYEGTEVNTAAVRTYAINSGASITLMPVVGQANIFSGGQIVSTIEAAVDYDSEPIIYVEGVNTTAFTNATYNINGEQSWGILGEIYDGFPSYVPKTNGTFRDSVSNSIYSLIAYADNFTASSVFNDPTSTSASSTTAFATAVPAAESTTAASTSGAKSIALWGKGPSVLMLCAFGALMLA